MSDSHSKKTSSPRSDHRRPMSRLRQQMSKDLKLCGMSKRTHDGYLREIRKLACYYNKSPDQLSQQQVGDYRLHLINDRNFAPGSLKVTYSALKFFYRTTCPRDWDVLKKLRIPKQKTLPDVLTIGEVRQLIAATRQLHNATFFWTVGDGRGALKYLAPYVNRVAISNNRIEQVTPTHVRYRFTPSGTKRSQSKTVTGNEFVRGFVQHTLPAKFQRLRYYGWAAPNCQLKFAWVQMLVWFYRGWCYLLKKQTPPQVPAKTPVRCKECGGPMQVTAITDGSGKVIYRRPLSNHALSYLDSG